MRCEAKISHLNTLATRTIAGLLGRDAGIGHGVGQQVEVVVLPLRDVVALRSAHDWDLEHGEDGLPHRVGQPVQFDVTMLSYLEGVDGVIASVLDVRLLDELVQGPVVIVQARHHMQLGIIISRKKMLDIDRFGVDAGLGLKRSRTVLGGLAYEGKRLPMCRA